MTDINDAAGYAMSSLHSALTSRARRDFYTAIMCVTDQMHVAYLDSSQGNTDILLDDPTASASDTERPND